MEQLANLFKALADPTRLRIMNLLLRSPFCVCEMERLLGLPQPLLSRHLAYLRNSGLVESNRDGMRVHYSLNAEDPRLMRVRAFLQESLRNQDVTRADPRALKTAV